MNRRTFRKLAGILHGTTTTARPTVDLSKLTPPTTNLNLTSALTPSQKGRVIVAYAKSLYVQYGITDWTFGFDKAKVRAGCCYSYQRKITLSTFFALNNTAEEIQGTIVHEIAHALAPIREHHGPIWQSIARAMGDSGDRCYDNKKVVMPEGKHLYECPSCEREVRYHKRKRRATACGKCCKEHNYGKYDAKYAFIYKGTGPSTPKPVSMPTPSRPATGSKSKTERMRDLYDAGTTSVGEIAKLVGAHYSHVHTVISKYKKNKAA